MKLVARQRYSPPSRSDTLARRRRTSASTLSLIQDCGDKRPGSGTPLTQPRRARGRIWETPKVQTEAGLRQPRRLPGGGVEALHGGCGSTGCTSLPPPQQPSPDPQTAPGRWPALPGALAEPGPWTGPEAASLWAGSGLHPHPGPAPRPHQTVFSLNRCFSLGFECRNRPNSVAPTRQPWEQS